MAKCSGIEFVKGQTNKNGITYDWIRLDCYFEPIDKGDPVRISAFLKDAAQARLIGLTDEECKKKM